ncbi:TPA: hypothetical protein ACQ29W_001828 [Klebsiella pneumoniae]|uniref:hypothetical protein n=1 Tax=Enterobacterales TaxID=91347 RepID=UPI000C771102|nr:MULTISPECIES: hypothetical protein [Enterobacterales]EEZ4372260.1 hypothetical protein [Escherichia coli]EKN4862935.1 hypothetical protein [Yersinia enterocolitica]HEJ8151849.1 hypothetical protein [Klebsiella oxytoca]EFO2393903.1 hypothetical protein [Escherichia coli]EJB8471640.1 hypothetical protein [Citrobacter freundii]
MNNRLNQLYIKNNDIINEYRKKHSDKNLHGPLLLNISNYSSQKIKLMVVGQETFGWNKSLSIVEQRTTYQEFNFGSSYYSSPFWNVIRKLERSLNIEPYAISWSNLNRFDVDCGSPDRTELAQDIASLDYLVKEEISILKPDVCIFFTNHKYDKRLRDLYQDLVFDNVHRLPKKHFSKLNHPDLPKYTLRAPHPRTIRTQRWEDDFITVVSQFKND